VGGDDPRPGAAHRPAAPDLRRPRAARLRADGGALLTGSAARRVLLLLPTNTYRAADFLAAADRLGIEAVVGSEQRQALEEVAPGRSLALAIQRPEEAARQIAAFAAERPLHAVIPTDEATAIVAALACEGLGLPHNPPDAARAAGRKDRLRAILAAAGVRAPRAAVEDRDADPAAAARRATYPCVLKPTFLAGSRGVIRADDPAAFAAAFARIAALLSGPELIEAGGEAARSILVEEFVPGGEVALEGLLTGGRLRVLALFDKPDPLDGPYFEETIYVTPSLRGAAEQEGIAAAAGAAAAAIGLREGPIHAELRTNEQGPWVIDLAARSIGGLCARTLRFGAGIALEDLILLHATGRDVGGYERRPGAAGVMMLPVPRAGRLEAIEGLEAARAVAGVGEVAITVARGSRLVPLPDESIYLGFIFADGGTPQQVVGALREAHARLRFVITPPAG
jgi:biotin carboxylase